MLVESGMSKSYHQNSEAQSNCHCLAGPLLTHSAQQIKKRNLFLHKTIRIGVYGCGPGDNDYQALKKYVLGHLLNCNIEIYMLDIVESKWVGTIKNDKITTIGKVVDLYSSIFPENYLDLVVSFSCLHWFDDLPPNMETDNKFCWSLLTNSNKLKIKQIMKERLDKFLQLRSRELNNGGQMVITFDGEIMGKPHQFQKISECVSNVLEELISLDKISPRTSDNFFIHTAPRTKEEVIQSLNSIAELDYIEDEIYITNILCPFKLQREEKLTEAILACLPNLEKIIPNIKDLVKEKVMMNRYYSTEGNVLVMRGCVNKSN